MALTWSQVLRLVYSAGGDDVDEMYSEARRVDMLAFNSDAYRDDIIMAGGTFRDECAARCATAVAVLLPWRILPIARGS